MVATHSEVATGALAVISICLTMKVFSYSQYLPTCSSNMLWQIVRLALNFIYLDSKLVT